VHANELQCSYKQEGNKGWFETRRRFITIAFQLSLEYAIRRVQVNQDDLKLNGTHQLLVHSYDVNVMGGS